LDPHSDQRSPTAIAYQWASRIITISIEMVLPGLAGYWLDQRIGLVPLFTVVGFGGGLVIGMWHLIRMSSARHNASDGQSPPSER
jgi:hypothetical protein